uniref:NADP-dependent oxidoreductase domain-containing protein n=1 Tax=Haptolina brevifila TaxID=156173 RepID=A0A7S2CTY2_9EUKA
MPAVGLGLWKVPKAVCASTVTSAIRMGYRHLDSACDYGNEKEVGQGIKAAIDEGLVTREELWVTSKLWNTYHRKEHVEAACQRTLADLSLSYVDLYLVHFPIALKYVPPSVRYPPEWIYDPDAVAPKMEIDESVPFRETWEGMEQLASLGVCKNIGVCNVNTALLRDLLSYASIPPAVLQMELHPYLQQPKLLRFCAENSIAVTGFSPLGAGSYVELGGATMAESALNDATVTRLAKAHGVSPAQLLLRWALQRGISVVPKSSKPERLTQNLALSGFELSDEQMAEMATLDRHHRYNDPGVFCESMGVFCPIYD